MKTSNKLLIGLLTCLLLAILGSNISLKAEYDKADFSNPFYGYSKKALAAFKVVRLINVPFGLVKIQSGQHSELHIEKAMASYVQSDVQGDTLLIMYYRPGEHWYRPVEEDFNRLPALYITSPALEAVYLEGATAKLTGWQQKTMLIEGRLGRILLEKSTIAKLDVALHHGCFVKSGSGNRIAEATLILRDSSEFEVKESIFGTIQIEADSLSNVKVPGALFNKITRR